jgi:hypothetical protein
MVESREGISKKARLPFIKNKFGDKTDVKTGEENTDE